MLSEKENSILDKAEDVILNRFQDCMDSPRPISVVEYERLMNGVRLLGWICRMKYQQTPQSDKSEAASGN